MNKNKIIILSISILMVGLITVGGTYAWLSYSINVTNGTASGTSTCFLIDYGIDNGDGTTNISGTLFQSADPTGGLDGRVNMKIKDTCTNITGKGNISLNLPNTISSTLTQVVAAHCEDSTNLQTIETTQANCTTGKTWVTTGSALKYAVSTNDTFTNIVSKGYITADKVGRSSVIWNGTNVGGGNIVIDSTVRYFYISIWLDGYLADNTYTEIPFSGYITASATQL